MDESANALHCDEDRLSYQQPILRWFAFVYVLLSASAKHPHDDFGYQAEIQTTSLVYFRSDALVSLFTRSPSQNLNIEYTIDAFNGAKTLQRFPTVLKPFVSYGSFVNLR